MRGAVSIETPRKNKNDQASRRPAHRLLPTGVAWRVHLPAALVKNNGSEINTHQWEMDTTYDIEKVGNHRYAAYIREIEET